MKISKISTFIFLLMAGLLWTTSALADYFTVGTPGSLNGNFTITGSVTFGSTSNCHPGSVFDDGNGGILYSCDLYDFSFNSTTCNATMHGAVNNGIAQITAVSLSGTTVVCSRIQFNGMGLPWTIQREPNPVGSSYANTVVKGIGFMSAALFNCHGVTSFMNIGAQYVTFSTVPGPGCFFETWGNASAITPSLNIVPSP